MRCFGAGGSWWKNVSYWGLKERLNWYCISVKMFTKHCKCHSSTSEMAINFNLLKCHSSSLEGKCLRAMSSERRLFTFSSRSECYGLKQEVKVMHVYHFWWSVRSIKQIPRIYAQMPGTFKWEKQQRRCIYQHDKMELWRVKLVNTTICASNNHTYSRLIYFLFSCNTCIRRLPFTAFSLILLWTIHAVPKKNNVCLFNRQLKGNTCKIATESGPNLAYIHTSDLILAGGFSQSCLEPICYLG